MKKLKMEQLENEMLETGLVTEETLQIVYSINGYKLETTESVLYAITGLRNLEQLQAES